MPHSRCADECPKNLSAFGPFLLVWPTSGIAIGFASLGCGIGQGILAGNTTAGIARNPGATGTMNTPFILGMVLIYVVFSKPVWFREMVEELYGRDA